MYHAKNHVKWSTLLWYSVRRVCIEAYIYIEGFLESTLTAWSAIGNRRKMPRTKVRPAVLRREWSCRINFTILTSPHFEEANYRHIDSGGRGVNEPVTWTEAALSVLTFSMIIAFSLLFLNTPMPPWPQTRHHHIPQPLWPDLLSLFIKEARFWKVILPSNPPSTQFPAMPPHLRARWWGLISQDYHWLQHGPYGTRQMDSADVNWKSTDWCQIL